MESPQRTHERKAIIVGGEALGAKKELIFLGEAEDNIAGNFLSC